MSDGISDLFKIYGERHIYSGGQPQDKIRQQILESETHVEIMDRVIDFLHLKSFHVAGFRPGMKKDGSWVTAVIGDGKGFPDVFAVRYHPQYIGLLVVEIKTENDEQSPEQKQWQIWCEEAGIPYIVVRPSTWEEFVRLLE